jgi:hypothetical protein
VTASLLQRQAALAGVALIAVLGALALGERGDEPPSGSVENVAPATQWRTATVGVAQRAPRGCGSPGEQEPGIVHPVLPCGAQVVVERGGTVVRTEVVGRGPVGLAHEFDLTAGLASRLGLVRADEIRWRFAE